MKFLSRSSSQVRTPGFHPGNRGSNPLRDAIFHFVRFVRLNLTVKQTYMAKDLTPIKIQGANENNLKNIDLEIIPGQLTVFTGLSGAGKSTLLFDVLHAEGQRKYVETFSPYVRQFLETLRRPNVKLIENIRPSIAVEQKNTIRNSRSTVGTMTELCDYFKVWFSHAASFYDPSSGQKLREETFESLS